MQLRKFSKRVTVISVALFALTTGFSSFVQAAEEYSFKVFNNTKSPIKKILVSEDGKEWGYFDVGKGIAAGKTEELVWDKSTNSEGCTQYFKAVFGDGSESKPMKFDFCESDLQLEFD